MDLTQAPFQVGDRVRINNIELGDHGREGVIDCIDTSELTGHLWPYTVQMDDGIWPFDAEELILVERAS